MKVQKWGLRPCGWQINILAVLQPASFWRHLFTLNCEINAILKDRTKYRVLFQDGWSSTQANHMLKKSSTRNQPTFETLQAFSVDPKLR